MNDGAQIKGLKEALQKVTGARGLGEDESLPAVLERLDAYADSPTIPDLLKHYLDRRSYQKALIWLDDPSQAHRA
jgi:hypothetical protein